MIWVLERVCGALLLVAVINSIRRCRHGHTEFALTPIDERVNMRAGRILEEEIRRKLERRRFGGVRSIVGGQLEQTCSAQFEELHHQHSRAFPRELGLCRRLKVTHQTSNHAVGLPTFNDQGDCAPSRPKPEEHVMASVTNLSVKEALNRFLSESGRVGAAERGPGQIELA